MNLSNGAINGFHICTPYDTITGENSHPYIGWLLLIMIITTVFFTYRSLNKYTKIFLHFAVITLVVFFTGLSFFSDALWGHYIVGLPVIFILIFSIATASLTGFRKYRPVILAAMCLYLLFLLRPQEIITRYTAPMWVGDASVYRMKI